MAAVHAVSHNPKILSPAYITRSDCSLFLPPILPAQPKPGCSLPRVQPVWGCRRAGKAGWLAVCDESRL